ncbi:MAG: formylmethanofuran dehydrogenase subunit B [Pirellulales bacterium]|nr:formylmethanofuran dehydrogenase subunit B [Pirellulales bacterium]
MPVGFLLIVGYSQRYGVGVAGSVLALGNPAEGETVRLAPQDAARLELATGDRVRLVSSHGVCEVSVAVVAHDELPPGLLFLPIGEASALLLGDETEATGMPIGKGIAVRLERCSSPARDAKQVAATSPIADTSPRAHASSLTVLEDAVCPFCSCTCDDLTLHVAQNAVVAVDRACELGRAGFLHAAKLLPADDEPACLVRGKPASLDEAIDAAAAILADSRYPVVFGLGDTNCEAQRAAVALADQLGANLDTTTSLCHGPSAVALQNIGEPTATLGEIRHRADLVIFWGWNPAESHPRHFERYSLDPAGNFLRDGRRSRTAVLVDVRRTPTAEAVDRFLRIKPHRDFEALWTLRALAQDLPLDAEQVERDTGISLAEWQSLMSQMRRARFGVILFGLGLTTTRGKHLNVEAMMALSRDMNRHTRFICKPMRGYSNLTGADNVLAWRCGFPFAVNYARGYPRFGPGEFTMADLLARREVDAALVVSGDPLTQYNAEAREHLRGIPTVVLDPRETETSRAATVSFRTAILGVQTGGTVYRMDEVPFTLRAATTSKLPSDHEVLVRLERRLQEGRAEPRQVACP